MIARDHDLPIKRQAELLELSRSSVYYQPRPVRLYTLALMRLEGTRAERQRIRRLMRIMGIEAIYRKKNTSARHAQHPVYPYLLRNLRIDRPNQVWATNITFVPMARGFVYLVAVIDWATRKILSWRISNTLTSDFFVAALQESINRYGIPDIFNTDQGRQFTSLAFTSVLKEHGIRISMDGKGCWRDNVFVERLWKSIKYEEIYLHAYNSVSDVTKGLMRYITFYNQRRPHTANGRVPPDYRYYQQLPQLAAA